MTSRARVSRVGRTDEGLHHSRRELPPRISPPRHHLNDLLHLFLRRRETKQVLPRRVPHLLGLLREPRWRLLADMAVD